jgi:hypothetical protein
MQYAAPDFWSIWPTTLMQQPASPQPSFERQPGDTERKGEHEVSPHDVEEEKPHCEKSECHGTGAHNPLVLGRADTHDA